MLVVLLTGEETQHLPFKPATAAYEFSIDWSWLPPHSRIWLQRLVYMPLQHRHKMVYDILNQNLWTELDAVVFVGGMLDLLVFHLHPEAVREVMGGAAGVLGQERYHCTHARKSHPTCFALVLGLTVHICRE